MDFTVDVEGLGALGEHLNDTVEDIDAATRSLAKAGAGTIGTDRLDRACEEFRSDWKNGLELLGESITEVRGALDAARKQYAEFEAEIEANLRELSSAMGDAGGGEAGGDGGPPGAGVPGTGVPGAGVPGAGPGLAEGGPLASVPTVMGDPPAPGSIADRLNPGTLDGAPVGDGPAPGSVADRLNPRTLDGVPVGDNPAAGSIADRLAPQLDPQEVPGGGSASNIPEEAFEGSTEPDAGGGQ